MKLLLLYIKFLGILGIYDEIYDGIYDEILGIDLDIFLHFPVLINFST